MFDRRFIAATIVAGVFLTSCGQPVLRSTYVPQSAASAELTSRACYVTPQKPRNVTATITFYGWPDNTPPGNAIAHPVIHNVASGSGTWCNPTTFATEPTVAENKLIPYGIKIYVPFLKQYFVREDDCTPSGPSTGSGNNGCYRVWFDLWIGGDGKSNVNALVNCELSMTPPAKVQVILYPKATMPVAHPGPIYSDTPTPNGTCYGKPGSPI
ncbi:MAG: hypothetical protein JO359_10895 [Candidatus Eremiobacteraeota bacterium]|nr:hypothetical protein [Candidatus Eremiobacteraeota bacterium]